MENPLPTNKEVAKVEVPKIEVPKAEESRKDDTVNLSEVLLADFAYIAQTAFQANEDRARATTFYLLSIGSVLATVFASQNGNLDEWRTALAFTVVFGALSILGIFTLLQLARLRAAWFSSIYAMNQIKAFALKHGAQTLDHNPFPWSNHNVPDRFEPKSVAAFLALQVLMMAAAMFGACIFHIGQLWGNGPAWLNLSIIGGLGWGILGAIGYFWALRP
jgi:hypothetical protein